MSWENKVMGHSDYRGRGRGNGVVEQSTPREVRERERGVVLARLRRRRLSKFVRELIYKSRFYTGERLRG